MFQYSGVDVVCVSALCVCVRASVRPAYECVYDMCVFMWWGGVGRDTGIVGAEIRNLSLQLMLTLLQA